jgi:hypothetical protein
LNLYAYCLRVEGDPPPPRDLTGIGDIGVTLLEEAGIGAWVAPIDDPGNPTPDLLARHDRVVRNALRTATPLPIRYRSAMFRDEDHAREALRDGAPGFLEALERVVGKVEVGLRVSWPEGNPPGADAGDAPVAAHVAHPQAGRGRAYLEARKREIDRAEGARQAAGAALDAVEAALALNEVESVRTLLPEPDVAGILAHLVHRDGLAGYRERVEAARTALPDYVIALTGPWAPYSFV